MHIPDGYLSPATCVVMYGASAPFWYGALRKVRKAFNARLIPLLSVISAFSFVIMMFNVPLPGGTTGHAVGVGVATVALGPWASSLALSTAIFIQAVFFGDGGITTLGANCFNMAIVGSLVAWLVYRVGAGRASLVSPRRVIAAAAAGYLAINASALCAAIELGIQPSLFKAASGAPLYAPYPLHIAIPAMMIGHLTFAGLAELVISGSVVAWLQHGNPALLAQTAPGAPLLDMPGEGFKQGWVAARPLWTGIALLMILTPLGILAAGSAWGEWSARDFSDPVARQQIMRASGRHAPPRRVPPGLEHWSSLWRAPFAGYQSPSLHARFLAYFISALAGAGVILAMFLAVSWWVERRRLRQNPVTRDE
jgi:cobalt/nickel transport system permease protein